MVSLPYFSHVPPEHAVSGSTCSPGSLFVSWHFVCLLGLLFPPELPAYPACHLLVSLLLLCLDFYQCGPLGFAGTFLQCLLIPLAGMIRKLLHCFLSCQVSQAVCQLCGPPFQTLYGRFHFVLTWHHTPQPGVFQPWSLLHRYKKRHYWFFKLSAIQHPQNTGFPDVWCHTHLSTTTSRMTPCSISSGVVEIKRYVVYKHLDLK